jgi:pyroglutamyl-peptidase
VKILLTGFEPFGSFRRNPSWDALERARDLGLFAGLEVALARIPVTWHEAFAAFERARLEHQPSLAISFGVHGGQGGRGLSTIWLETTARNRDGASAPDNAGVLRPERPIEPGGPEALPSGLPVAALRDALERAGFDCGLSDDAGKYLCNHLFYRASRALRGGIPYGFVHVPPVEGDGGTLSLDDLARAVALVAGVARKASGDVHA